jgi:NADPH:quinone reductase-like Zn-dependent oxidoreductase
MKTMSFAEYGSADVLRLEERPMPVPQANEVLIKVLAAGVNPADWRFREGRFRRGMPLSLPFVPGNDVAGIVVRVGQSVTSLCPGDRVFAMSPLKQGGAYAEFIVISASLVAPAPVSLPLPDAAAIPLAGLTALQALRKEANLKPEQNLLVVGASGGVGHFAVQIGKAIGATVTAVSSSRNFDFTRSLGADATLDYNDPKIYGGPRAYDVIFDAVAIEKFSRWKNLIKPNGVIVTVNPIIGKILPGFMMRLMGIPNLRSFFVQPDYNGLMYLKELADCGLVKPVIEKRFPLAQCAAAHRSSESGHVRGKLVIEIQSE